jgi:RNA polymerase sigma-70 factor (ECF subfamily)
MGALAFGTRGPVAMPESEATFDQKGLIERCIAGDPAAHRAFYDRYAGFVLRTARRLGIEQDEVEDVAQEVFSVAFSRLHTFKTGELTTWLYRICSNRVTDRHRRRGIRRTLAHLLGGDSSQQHPAAQERDLERNEAERMVSEILSRMSAKKRDVFVLFEIEGLPGDQIAARLGCPVDTVWTRLFHARREFERIGRARRLLGKMEGQT